MGKALVVIMFLVLVGMRSPAISAANAQATPAGTPAAVGCTVQPRTVAGINEVGLSGATPIPGTPFPDIDDATPYVRPEGVSLSEQATEGVTSTIEQFAACINVQDYLRFLALFSDDFIRTYAADLELPLDEDDPILTPSPVPEEDRILIANIADLIELRDGRVNALVILTNLTAPGETFALQLTLTYDQDRERWLIDDFQPVEQEEDRPTAWTLVQGEGYEGVIASEAGAEELTSFYIGGAPVEDFWTPTEKDIAALELSLPVYLQTVGATEPGVSADFVDRLPEYKRQYAGFVQSGRRLILVNATCADDLDWQTQPVIVMDGGDCFFRIVYDPAAGTFEGFEVNGEA